MLPAKITIMKPNNPYTIRNRNGKFAKIVPGRLYKVDGIVARYTGRDSEHPELFTFRLHKIFTGRVSADKISFCTDEEVKNYLGDLAR